MLFTVNNIVYKQKGMMSPMWLSICTFLQNFMALSLLVFELCWLKKKKKMNKTHTIIAPYIYDARYHAHPILSTTVLSDREVVPISEVKVK